ncbi:MULTISPECIES: CvpA family protein [unclassified Granulicatella]|uniref:CvpA family protein n=1 Tax=unclassified Granulicatella TaxID=2630493 RepID=UPI00143074E5|nr:MULTISPECIES: CvpA family protein [unclassified Granulicatella]MBF0780724.1 CvpA family protein [Granulicatella sp. 19428wC4_WM01]
MANIILLIILLIGIYSGARRGLIVQTILTVGYLVTWIVGALFYQHVAKILQIIIPFPSNTTASQLSLYNLATTLKVDETFYNALAFVCIMFVGWIVTRLVAATLNRLGHIPIISQLNTLGGAVLGFLCSWIGLYFLLTLLSFVPVVSVQDIFKGQSLATIIVKHTPIISQLVIDTWIVK